MGKPCWWDPRQPVSTCHHFCGSSCFPTLGQSMGGSQVPTGNTDQSYSCWVALPLSFLSGLGPPRSDWTQGIRKYVFEMATWAVCCAGLLEHCLAFWRECQVRGPILWKPGNPAPGETPLHHSLTELAESKLSSVSELLTVITVGVGSGKFNKLFGKFSIPNAENHWT